MSIVRAKKEEGSTAQAYFGVRKEITKEDRQEAARFSDVALNGYQLPTRKHILPLANALSRNKFLREVEIRDSCLCAAALETLAASLADAPHLTSVNLSCNTIDRGLKASAGDHGVTEFARDTGGVRALAEVVSVQKLVAFLNLSKNGLDWRTAEILSEYLCDHPALVDLDLSINFIGAKGAVYLAKLVKANNVLQRLNVRANHIGSLGLDLLCRSLRVNRGLTELNLRNNNLDDDSVRTLADTIRVGCRSLIKLDLSYNKFGPKGVTALAFGITSKHLGLRELVLDYNPLTTAGTDFSGIIALGEGLKENRSLAHLSLVGVALVGNYEDVRYAQGKREQKEFLLQGVRALADVIENNNVLVSMDLRENSMGPATGKVIEEALKRKPTCLPYVRAIRKYMDWNIAKSLFRTPDYPMASRSWLRIRFYRNILRMIEEKRFVLADW